jgi:hypothetical protein
MPENGLGLQTALARASTITIVVHGVGDHSAVNILASAERGFLAMMAGSASQFEVSPVSGAEELLPKGVADVSVSAAQMAAAGKTHVILALVWSSTRQRLAAAMRFARQKPQLQEYVGAPQVILAAWVMVWAARWCAAVDESLHIYWKRVHADLLRLPAKARGPWKLGVAAAVLAASLVGFTWTFTAITTALLASVGVLAAGEVSLQIWDALQGRDGIIKPSFRPHLGKPPVLFPYGPDWWSNDWYHWGLVAAAALLLAMLALQAAKVIDLMADVSSYVGDDANRRRVMHIVEHVLRRALTAGNSRVFVVGHSLGSALMSHVVAEKQLERPVTLVTLGSPLPLMSRVFKDVHSPAELLRIYQNSGSVECWLHAYRDADVIGRSLLLGTEKGYIECGLGHGPHWNYFSDVRLWRRMAALLQADSKDDYREFREAVAAWEIDAGERRELMGWRLLLGVCFVLMAVAAAPEWKLRAYLAEPEVRYFLGRLWTIMYALWVASGTALAAGLLMLILATSSYLRTSTPRQSLQTARLWRVLVLIFPCLQTMLGLAALLLCLSRVR